ncbi:MAG: hypothetical protein Q4D98_02385 [Planctomycetia bacterium]|nr:hypothetical protein [Planctomycetia bacterium]
MFENRMKWRWGDTSPVTVDVASTTAVKSGDLLWLNATSKKAEPADTFAFDTSLAKTQEAFASKFLGVAMQDSPSGTSGYIRVATTGVFELDDSTAGDTSACVGDYRGAVVNTAGTYLVSDKVISVSESYQAIARIAHTENALPGKALVQIQSTIMRGGVAGSDPKHETSSN